MKNYLYVKLSDREFEIMNNSCAYYGVSFANLAKQIVWTCLTQKFSLNRVKLLSTAIDKSTAYPIPNNLHEAWSNFAQKNAVSPSKCFRLLLNFLPTKLDNSIIDVNLDRPINWDKWLIE